MSTQLFNNTPVDEQPVPDAPDEAACPVSSERRPDDEVDENQCDDVLGFHPYTSLTGLIRYGACCPRSYTLRLSGTATASKKGSPDSPGGKGFV